MPFPIRDFPEHKQEVLKALTLKLPRKKWRKMPPVCRMLLVAVVTLYYPERYHCPRGYLTKSWRELSNQLFNCDYGSALSNSARLYEVIETPTEGSNLKRFKATPEIQEILDALKKCSRVFDPPSP